MNTEKVEHIDLNKALYIFELDDVLFPKQDYVLQVYYLFGSFYEFTEGTAKANELAQLMKKVHLHHGEDKVFDAVKEIYHVDEKYRENLERLRANAQLPLRLELFDNTKTLLKQLFEADKKVAILTKGNPVEQLNKLKFINWAELDIYKDRIKIYFLDELLHRNIDVNPYLADDFGVSVDDMLLIG